MLSRVQQFKINYCSLIETKTLTGREGWERQNGGFFLGCLRIVVIVERSSNEACSQSPATRPDSGAKHVGVFKMWAVNLLRLLTRHQSYITSVSVQLQVNDSTAVTPSFITASPNWIGSCCALCRSCFRLRYEVWARNRSYFWFYSVFLALVNLVFCVFFFFCSGKPLE